MVLSSLTAIAAQSADDGELVSKLIGANIGAAIAVLGAFRRLKAAQRGDTRLERHFLWQLAPVFYASVWLLVAGFAIALIRRDSPGLDEILGFASFVALWLFVGVLLVRDRRVELAR